MTTYIAAFVLSLLFSAFFSSARMSYASANRMRIESAEENGARPKAVKGALSVLRHLDFALSALSAGNCIANVSAAVPAAIQPAAPPPTTITRLLCMFREILRFFIDLVHVPNVL